MGKLLAAFLYLISTSSIAAVSLGSGFFITSDGYFVTNHHVIANATAVHIRDHGKTLRATIAVDDAVNDIAILKVEGTFEALALGNSRTGRPGTRVVTMGFPLVTIQGAEPKITEGIINSITGLGNDPRVFQISAAIQPGNSGGPLVTDDGSVIGIVIAKLSALSVFKQTGSLPENVNYAVKSNYLLELTSVIDSADKKLLKPMSKPFANTEKLAAYISKAIVIVIAERSDPPKEATQASPSPTPIASPTPVARVPAPSVSPPPAVVWIKVGVNDRFTIYADPASIAKQDPSAMMWSMFDYKTLQTGPTGKKYMSAKRYFEYDCKEERGRAVALVIFDEAMGRGYKVAESSPTTGSVRVETGTAEGALLKYACTNR